MDCYVKVEEEGRRRLRRSEGKGEPSPFLLLMDREEWKQKRGDYLKGEEPLGGRGPSRCCKVEWAGDCLTGVLRVPEIEKAGAFRLGMGFCLLPDRLVFIGEEGDVKGWVEGRLPALRQLQSPEHLLRELLEGLMGEDLLRLSKLEEKLEELEGSMEKADPNTFLRARARYRRKLSRLGAYYTQLTAAGERFQEGGEEELWEKFIAHAQRLQDHVGLLREDLLQLRELFQALQDARQNRVMGLLTVVTTLFLPLTLLTGWYGMNFARMPELQWRYGYLALIVVAGALVALEVAFFIKKKFF